MSFDKRLADKACDEQVRWRGRVRSIGSLRPGMIEVACAQEDRAGPGGLGNELHDVFVLLARDVAHSQLNAEEFMPYNREHVKDLHHHV